MAGRRLPRPLSGQKTSVAPDQIDPSSLLRVVVGAFASLAASPVRWLVSMSEAIDEAWDVNDPLLSGDLPVEGASH